ncbi:flagellar associated protein [Scenedesmus sp. NREL 46B-D3]|nr:flagellar associated protein [Scenedesmus sp. NREL 46B-D3]
MAPGQLQPPAGCSQARLAASLAEEKRARRLAEDDALRLYNRIRQLQKEEERADRRIKQTKQRAVGVQQQQRHLLERMSEKATREAALQAQLERQVAENQKIKHEHERIRQQVESRLLAGKASLAAATKEQRAELAAELEVLQARSLAAVVAKKEAVKQQQASGATKVQQHKAAKQAVAHLDYERRLREELEVKAAKEQEIAGLAQLEVQLIERLRLKQQQQVQAARQLEEAVAMRQSVRQTGTTRV